MRYAVCAFLLALGAAVTVMGCGGDGGNAGPNDLGTFDTGNDAADLLAAVNAHREAGARCGGTNMPPVPPLSRNATLEQSAQEHTQDMVDRDFFDHPNPDGDGPGDRISALGYSWSAYGENIAGGSSTVNAVMNQWMNSTGHCENIMSENFTEFGMGRVGNHWTQVFGRPL